MLPVLPRTNFMGRKARDFFFYAVVCQSSQSCLVARTKTSDVLELKTLPRLREWQRLPSGNCAIARANRSARDNCVTNCGDGSLKMFQTQSKTARTRRDWQTH